ncbi:MAG: AMIN domain-containing protein [bacterium]|nr:AMIN domain-containing protein [bacterium]
MKNKKHARLDSARQVFRIVTILLLFVSSLLYSGEVKKIQVTTNGELKVFIFTNVFKYIDFILHNPERIVIDFENAISYLSPKIKVNISPILSIRSSQFRRVLIPVTRVVIDLDKESKYSISRTDEGVIVNLGISVAEKKKIAILPEPFFYHSRGKRDPFKPWLGIPAVAETLLDVSKATIVGIMWSPKDKYALAQDQTGKGYILREGDPVSDGKVELINKNKVTFAIRSFGGIKRITLKLLPIEEKK